MWDEEEEEFIRTSDKSDYKPRFFAPKSDIVTSQKSPSSNGNIRESRNEILMFEWEIDDFLQKADNVAKSPKFYFSYTSWYLDLRTCDDATEWLSLHLCCSKTDKSSPIVEFGLGWKKLDGTPYFQQTFIRKFDGSMKYGINFFALRSKLMEQNGKEEMAISDPFTIVCKMKSISPTSGDNPGFGFFPGLLSTTEHSDLTIKVKDQDFHSHKVILAASSEVFSAMFSHKMSENNSGVVNIDDCEPESFKLFLNFLYSGTTNITDSNVYQLYSIGHKYCVESLISYCIGYMILHLSVDNFCEVANLGHKYSDNDITIACSEFFEQNVRKILLTSHWKLLMKNNYLLAFKLLEYIASRISIEKKD